MTDNQEKLNEDLFWAAAGRGKSERVKELISLGASPTWNNPNWARWTALQFAAYHGHNDIVNILLQNGADVKSTNKDGKTALHYAAEEGETDTVSILLQNGADVKSTDKYGRTPLHYASNRDLAELFIMKEASIHAVDKDGNTHVHSSTILGRRDIFSVFISTIGIDSIYTKNNDGMTPLDILCHVEDNKADVKYGRYIRSGKYVNKDRKECLDILKVLSPSLLRISITRGEFLTGCNLHNSSTGRSSN